ncbi:MAG: DUF6088 family protein [Rubritalea sp.]|uniref:DUF6088 family protein n=1 Tax=Rubritalea sp. TaxID=2109375 RepID=UPI00324262AB
MKSIENKTSSRIYANHRGWAFSKIDFLDIGNDADIRKALSELASKGTIRRVLRGLYDYPRISKLLGTEMGPDIDQVARALARKSGWRIQPSENTALNLLGLSTQVPAQSIYLSDGPSKTYEIGKQQLTFKKRSLKESVFKHKESELVVQALKALGQERIDDALISQLADKWSPSMWKKILRDTKTAPAWVSNLILQITKRTEA